MIAISFKRHRLPPEINKHAFWLYARFTGVTLVQVCPHCPGVANPRADQRTGIGRCRDENRYTISDHSCGDCSIVAGGTTYQ